VNLHPKGYKQSRCRGTGKQGGGNLPLVRTIAGRDSLPRPGSIKLHPLPVIWLLKCLIAQVDSHPLDWTSGSNSLGGPLAKGGLRVAHQGPPLQFLLCFPGFGRRHLTHHGPNPPGHVRQSSHVQKMEAPPTPHAVPEVPQV